MQPFGKRVLFYSSGKENSLKKRFTDQQVIRILREAERPDEHAKDLCRRHNISERTFYRRRDKFGGMDVTDVRRLKELESENERLKRWIPERHEPPSITQIRLHHGHMDDRSMADAARARM